MERLINGLAIKLTQGDITELDLDAIVNAANRHLQLGAGVAGAIRRKGGPEIQKECNRIGDVNVGDAVITTGGDLKARHVIHAVGPHASNSNADELLAKATDNSLRVAATNKLTSIAFPAVSTGIFGYPMHKCAQIMLKTAAAYAEGAEDSSVSEVVFCLYDTAAYEVFETEMNRQFSE